MKCGTGPFNVEIRYVYIYPIMSSIMLQVFFSEFRANLIVQALFPLFFLGINRFFNAVSLCPGPFPCFPLEFRKIFLLKYCSIYVLFLYYFSEFHAFNAILFGIPKKFLYVGVPNFVIIGQTSLKSRL